MKKSANLLFVLLFIFITVTPAFAVTMPVSEKMAKLISERQTDCWVEGKRFGDMILGSRGVVNFIYLDKKLSEAITEEPGLASWIDDMNQYYGSVRAKKKAVFIVHIKANKPWEIKETYFNIGGHVLTKDDILSSSWKNPFGTISAGEQWYFACAVPKNAVRPGKVISLGYREFLENWRVPK